MKEAVPWWFFFPDVTFHYLMWLSVSPPCHGDDVTFPAWCDLGPALVLCIICWGCSHIFSFSLHGGNVPLVIPLTYLFWMGGTFVFFIWWFGVKKGCGGAGSSALHVVVNALDNSWIRVVRGVVRGVVRLYVQHLFSFVFFVCSFFLSSSLSFSQTVTSSLFIVSFVHSVLLPLNSLSIQTIVAEWLFVMQSSAGRRVVCSARGGLSRVCYNGTLYPSNEGNPLVFWWIAVTLLWPGRGDFSASGLSTFKKIALTSALDCTCKHGLRLHFTRHVRGCGVSQSLEQHWKGGFQ